MRKNLLTCALSAILLSSFVVAPISALASPVEASISVVEPTQTGEQVVEPQAKAKIAAKAIEALADKLDSSYIDNIIDYIPSQKAKDALLEGRHHVVNELRFYLR
ncbi:hypothetical protein ASL14_00670 [Paenibacillus sp. IHB B 3084]|uniref:hypothetical protein n=1 Tax=Paenibacillus sp. IHB B 3084 TaxID=867076 RepID=UPI000722A2B9|nr:hypothetical protein [Paenibacillus sp. IHB B 3084]ALP34904.1 hypothetical protein ASL14_00670 [Paenibacillus sp. IHB B 3084]